jgi:hypothetical protein
VAGWATRRPAAALSAAAILDGVVADLSTPRGTDAAAALASRAVGWVSTENPQLAAALDVQDGLVRQAGDQPLLWRVTAPSTRLQLLDPGAARMATSGARSVPGPRAVTGAVPPGPSGRLLVLAEQAGEGWRATVDGRVLGERTAYGWAQAFALPAAGGEVRVVRDGDRLRVAVQALLVLAVAVLAAPGSRARQGLER